MTLDDIQFCLSLLQGTEIERITRSGNKLTIKFTSDVPSMQDKPVIAFEKCSILECIDIEGHSNGREFKFLKEAYLWMKSPKIEHDGILSIPIYENSNMKYIIKIMPKNISYCFHSK